MPRKKYRSQAGIIYDILQTVYELGEAAPTRIMYGANLPFDRAKLLIETLVKKGLLERVTVKDRTYLRLTEKGYEALKELEKSKRILEELGFKF